MAYVDCEESTLEYIYLIVIELSTVSSYSAHIHQFINL